MRALSSAALRDTSTTGSCTDPKIRMKPCVAEMTSAFSFTHSNPEPALQSLAHADVLAERGLEKARIPREHGGIHDENDGAAHFEASEFLSLFKRNGAFRSPVHARSVPRELPDVRHEGIRVRDRDAAYVRGTDLHHERFPALREPEARREAFVDGEKAFHTFHAARVHGPERTGAVARGNHGAVRRGMYTVVIERGEIDRRPRAADEFFRKHGIAEEGRQRISLPFHLNHFKRRGIEYSGLRKVTVHRAHDFRGGDRAHTGFEAADEERADVRICGKRLFRFVHIEPVMRRENIAGFRAQERHAEADQETEGTGSRAFREESHKNVKGRIHSPQI